MAIIMLKRAAQQLKGLCLKAKIPLPNDSPSQVSQSCFPSFSSVPQRNFVTTDGATPITKVSRFQIVKARVKLTSKQLYEYWWATGRLQILTAGGLLFYLWYSWMEGLHMKHRLTLAAKDPKPIERMLASEWSGLKSNVGVKVNGEETRLPLWNWLWFWRTLPNALFSWHPIDEITLKNRVRSQQSKAKITPIDFSPVISTMLNAATSQFLILNGQKGTGKSTAMLLLCLHEIKHQRAALFLRLCQDSNRQEDTFTFTRAIKKDPSFIDYLANVFAREMRAFTIVVDDLHKYLKSPETKENAAIVIGYLWQATEYFGVRVIFPTNDYGLRQSILDLPMHHNDRFQQVRMYAPGATELVEMIKSGIKGKGQESVSGNSEIDITRYCEVSGTMREVQLNYLKTDNCSSVKEVTQTLFNSNVEALQSLFQRILKAQSEKMKAGKWMRDIELYTGADVKSVLITLCNKQYVDPADCKTYAICEELTNVNVTRPVNGLSGRFEFSSFQMEVAVRAIYDLPATPKPTVQGIGEPESGGRGTSDTLTTLKAGMKTFETEKNLAHVALKQ